VRHRVVIVGPGNIASHRHIPALRRSGRADIIGVVDVDKACALRVARQFRIPNAAPTLDAPWVEDADVAIVSTPPMLHAELSEAALRRGKHVLQEKPTGLTLAEGERIRRSAEDADRIFGIVHNFQFARSTLKLQRMLEEGRLGDVLSINAFQSSSPLRRLPEWSEELPLGLFCDESPHFFYLFRAFGGHTEITDVVVRRSRRKPATPHLVTAHLDTEVAPAFLYCSFESSVSEWYFMLICERAVAVIDIFRDLLIVSPHDGTHLAPDMMRTSLADTWQHWLGVARSGSLHLLKRLDYGMDEVVRRFLDGVDTGTEPRGVGITDALEVLRLQQEVVARAEAQADAARGAGRQDAARGAGRQDAARGAEQGAVV
jgi:predicted dehydrogenase